MVERTSRRNHRRPRTGSDGARRMSGVAATWIVVAVVALLAGALWVGLRVPAAPFPAYPAGSEASETVPLPGDLPAPVARFYRGLYGDEVPVIDTAVVSGRARLRIMGLTLPARFRFTHEAGRNYRHAIETTLFGVPVMTIDETFVGGAARLALPFGVTENEPKVDQAANLGLWAEAVWFPAVWLTDERVRWEAVDATTALLAVPFGDATERFVARFDPDSGRLRLLESMRYRDADAETKTLWLNEVLRWDAVDGHTLPVRSALTWFDEGRPWAWWTVEEVVYNTDVEGALRTR